MSIKIHGQVFVFWSFFGLNSNDVDTTLGKSFVGIFEDVSCLSGIVGGYLVGNVYNLWVFYRTKNCSFYRCNGVIFISKIGH